MNIDVWMQILRYAMIWGGGVLISRGIVSEAELEMIVGATVSLVPTLWGIWVRWNTKAVPAAVAARPDVPTASPVTGKIDDDSGDDGGD